jgi:hypothetical protein
MGFNPGLLLVLDQRRAPRTADGNADGLSRCDVGAYELQPPATPATEYLIRLPLIVR